MQLHYTNWLRNHLAPTEGNRDRHGVMLRSRRMCSNCILKALKNIEGNCHTLTCCLLCAFVSCNAKFLRCEFVKLQCTWQLINKLVVHHFKSDFSDTFVLFRHFPHVNLPSHYYIGLVFLCVCAQPPLKLLLGCCCMFSLSLPLLLRWIFIVCGYIYVCEMIACANVLFACNLLFPSFIYLFLYILCFVPVYKYNQHRLHARTHTMSSLLKTAKWNEIESWRGQTWSRGRNELTHRHVDKVLMTKLMLTHAFVEFIKGCCLVACRFICCTVSIPFYKRYIYIYFWIHLSCVPHLLIYLHFLSFFLLFGFALVK